MVRELKRTSMNYHFFSVSFTLFLEEGWRFHWRRNLEIYEYDKNRETLGRVSSIIQVQRGWNRFQSRWGKLKSNFVETELEWTWIRTCNLNPSSGRSTPMRHTRNYFHLRGTAQVSGGGRRGKALQLIGKWWKFYSRMRHTRLSLRISYVCIERNWVSGWYLESYRLSSLNKRFENWTILWKNNLKQPRKSISSWGEAILLDQVLQLKCLKWIWKQSNSYHASIIVLNFYLR